MHDPHATGLDHVLGGVGTVGGRLTGYAGGIAFVATAAEERLREQGAIAIVLDRSELRAVYTVPAGAGVDGRSRRRGWSRRTRMLRPRGWHRGLVLRTDQGGLLFELRRARRRADLLAARYDLTREADRA